MKENTEETKQEGKSRKIAFETIIKGTFVVLLALSVGYIHYRYVSQLFDNDRNFSYLSDLEREMSLRTEMGFYYSYYKTIVEEKQLIAGITKVMYDKLVEFPHEVNAFNRFNIYPEVIIGALYRYLTPWLNTTTHLECHMVNRGDGLSPVESCVGLAHPMFFYLEAVWWLAGLTVAALFLHAVMLSESIIGGLAAVVQYFANHSECTRVQWAPNERENLALPLLLAQAWLLTRRLRGRRGGVQLQSTIGGLVAVVLYFANHSECTRVQWAPNERENLALPLLLAQAWLLTRRLRGRRGGVQLQVSIFTLNCLCLLFWQFTQFVFLTQTAIFFVMEQLRIIDIKALSIFLHSHFCGLHMAVLLLQGNDMLKSSLYTSFFLVVSAYCLFFSSLRVKVENRIDLFVESWLVVLRILIVVLASFYLKKVISEFLEVQDDAHVWAILLSKMSEYKTFHTMIYTCSEVFNFLPFSSVRNLTESLLIPLAMLGVVNAVVYWTKRALVSPSAKEKEDPPVELERDDDDDSGIENGEAKVRRRKPKVDLDLIDKEIKSRLEGKDRDNLVLFLSRLEVEPAIFYNVSQLVVYAIMAALVMRLKLLFATQLCLVSALAFNRNYYT